MTLNFIQGIVNLSRSILLVSCCQRWTRGAGDCVWCWLEHEGRLKVKGELNEVDSGASRTSQSSTRLPLVPSTSRLWLVTVSDMRSWWSLGGLNQLEHMSDKDCGLICQPTVLLYWVCGWVSTNEEYCLCTSDSSIFDSICFLGTILKLYYWFLAAHFLFYFVLFLYKVCSHRLK